MFRIRQEQLQSFVNEAEDRFIETIVKHIHADFAKALLDYGWDDKTLEAQIRKAMSSARAFGIEYEEDIRSYIDTVMLLGPDFYKQTRYTWAKDILTDKTTDGESKMAAIEEYLVFGMGGGT